MRARPIARDVIITNGHGPVCGDTVEVHIAARPCETSLVQHQGQQRRMRSAHASVRRRREWDVRYDLGSA
jgi:hypothetical protein